MSLKNWLSNGWLVEHKTTSQTRDKFFSGLGLTVIRILAGDVLHNMDGVVTFLSNHPALTGTPPREGNLPALTDTTTPSPDGATPPREGNII